MVEGVLVVGEFADELEDVIYIYTHIPLVLGRDWGCWARVWRCLARVGREDAGLEIGQTYPLQ